MENKIKDYFQIVSDGIEIPKALKNRIMKGENKQFIAFALASSLIFSALIISILFEIAPVIDPLLSGVILP